MILIEGKKFACDTCIKGHRSSACKHTDRPLFEIQKKGRPITQCTHCRELRKTKQVHVKCLCGDSKGINKDESVVAKPLKRTLDATYPTGVPTALEASLVLYPDPSSDSDQPSSKPASCNCKTDGECHCAVPRKIKRTHQKDSTDAPALRTTCSKPIRPNSDLARNYHLILPKPPQSEHNRLQNDPGPIRIPSTAANGHLPRHHSHADMFYSPYERAYESSHSYDHSGDGFEDPNSIEELIGIGNIFTTNPDGQSIPWNMFNMMGSPSQLVCGCGESCACQACFEHRGPAQALLSMSLGGVCANPNTCTSCLRGDIMTGSEQAGPTEISIVDEWIRQLEAPLSLPYGSQSLTCTSQVQVMSSTSTLPQYSGLEANSNLSALWAPTKLSGTTECCGGGCKCPPGLCSCASDCCGCCQGCVCEGHQHRERGHLTFAVSGERSPCCSSSTSCIGRISSAQPSVVSSPGELVNRSRASSIDGLQEWNPRYDPQMESCSKGRTTAPAMLYYVSTNDRNAF